MNTKEQTRMLWKTCFDDDDDFVELYFNMRYQDETNQVIVEDGRVVSALQMIPYPMTFCGELIPMSYISGACTLPDYRRRGLMRRLLKQTHRAMYEQGVLLATLIPAEDWLMNYYALEGYATCFNYALKVINSNEYPVDNYKTNLFISKIDLQKPVSPSVYTFFNEQMNRRSCCVQHSLEDLEVVLADLRLAGGDLWTAREGGELTGMAFCIPQNGTLSVKEMLFADSMDEPAMLAHILHACSLAEAECIVPSEDAAEELGMARFIDIAACLQLFARSESGKGLDFDIQIEGDDAIPENNGYYSLSGGELYRGFTQGKTYRLMTVHQLTAWVMSRLYPYMSLMLN